MELTIGAFARAVRLSPKALRLYDELGLLHPARVDPHSGYRYYTENQLEHARLVSWLRRLGMPLTRIRTVCASQASDAAAEVASYWAEVERLTDEQRRLATFLVEHLSGKDCPDRDERKGTEMADGPNTITLRYAVQSDHGRTREYNQDWAYAGDRLFAVADGFGDHGDADPVSALAVEALKPLDDAIPAGDLLNTLQNAVGDAEIAVRDFARSDPAYEGVGTTLTAMLLSGSQLALVHVGDSRAYLLRDGSLTRITHDHTVVQRMVDSGQITADEAASHPQRSILSQALHGGEIAAVDSGLHEVRAGDRYMLCSDGLSGVVEPEGMRSVLKSVDVPEKAVRRLVQLANERGGPDNITCVVADVVAKPVE
ncbi:MerR family transcriptional regulator [Allosaccharopolyspora coralli]|uniref:MerR family transcriptional regulator n=1 Tax=Allosaccharopolyspora coralli TaxID=2665642 RepID=A0A5Q3Q834_9PSEU|nr:MerR family transcriptional regulator [Allosaccharopolyspora coralli]QGK70533.1 MerR family transcriptional regulator [Allosaccharopolyspora coralli]